MRYAATLALTVIALTLAGCAGQRRDDGAARPSASGQARVTHVSDGDTIVVLLRGRSEKVRYIGIDTPESVKEDTPVQCFARQASEENERLVGRRWVRLVFDRELRDDYGRLLAYVYVGSVLVNAELVRRGYARTLRIEPNTAKAGELARLEARAARAGRGLWGACVPGSRL